MNIENKVENKDTFKIQITSIDLFMDILGYKRAEGSTRYSNGIENSNQRYISFNTARKLHNTKWEYDVSNYMFFPVNDYRFCMTTEQYYKSQGRKIVEAVKIQCNKYGVLQIQSHVVKFTAEWYYDLLIGDE